jgi:hypothetical protein
MTETEFKWSENTLDSPYVLIQKEYSNGDRATIFLSPADIRYTYSYEDGAGWELKSSTDLHSS